MPNYNPNDVEREFLEFLQKLGIPPLDSGGIILDSRKHRYRIEGDRARQENGEYCVHMDGWPAGYAKSYSAKHGVEYVTWSFSAGGMEYTEEERAEWKRKREDEVRQKSEEERRQREYAAKTAGVMWANATVEGVAEHKYIQKKGITNFTGIRRLGGELIVPLYDQFGEINNVQRISADGDKRFLSGGRKRGCFYRLPCDGRFTFICEGVATALTVREATGCACIIAYDAGNLLPVLENVRDTIVNLVFAADNDRKTVGNPGLFRAMEAAYELCIPVVVPFNSDLKDKDNGGRPGAVAPTATSPSPLPSFEKGAWGSDWNDYAAVFGIEATAEEIYRQIKFFLSDLSRRRVFEFPECRVDSKGNLKPFGCLDNFDYLLRFHGISIRYNEIARDIEVDIPNVKYSLDNRRNASLSGIFSLMSKSGLRIDKNERRSYMAAIADANSYNPAADFIQARKWDGGNHITRLANTLTLDNGCSKELVELLLRKWLISGVAAAFSRGENDKRNFWTRGVLVLLGPQAIGKTSWFRSLAPSRLFSEGISLSLDDKDAVKRAISTWITEFGELDGTFKRSDMARLKAFISNQFDDIRLPYAENNERLIRRTIFCASANRMEILQDDTGSSRWWIIPVTNCRLDNDVDIGQVWAHALELYNNGEQWWLSRDEETELALQNEKFEPSNKFEDLILSKFNFSSYQYDSISNSEYTTMEVLKICGIQNPPPGECVSCSAVLRKLTGHASVRSGKDRRRVFQLPPEYGIYQK